MNLLLVNGSPRRRKVSYSFARELKRLAEETGHQADIIHAIDYLDGKADEGELQRKLKESEIIGLCTPLYVDTLPYPVMALLETLAEEYTTELDGKRFFTIAGCGFPDSTLFQPIFGTCECFARATAMTWLGGMGTGGAPMLDGKSPAELGKRGKAISQGLQLALAAVLDDRSITDEARDSFSLNIPRFLLRPLAWYLNRNAKKDASTKGTNILARPYQ